MHCLSVPRHWNTTWVMDFSKSNNSTMRINLPKYTLRKAPSLCVKRTLLCCLLWAPAPCLIVYGVGIVLSDVTTPYSWNCRGSKTRTHRLQCPRLCSCRRSHGRALQRAWCVGPGNRNSADQRYGCMRTHRWGICQKCTYHTEKHATEVYLWQSTSPIFLQA